MEANLSLMYVISLFSVLIAFAFAAYLFLWVRRQKSTNARINEVAALIKEGANTFMRKEYRVLSIFAGIAAVIIFLLLPSPVWTGHPGRNLSMAAAYVAGTALSVVLWLGLTLALLIGNILAVLGGTALDTPLHIALGLVSAPMFCSNYWVVSLFLWAVLLVASFVKKK